MHVPVLVLLCSSISLAIFVPPEKKVVCYHTSWSRYRQSLANFTPQNINPYLCTHIHYALANSNEDQQLGPADPFADFIKKGYAEFTALKEANPALKTVLMLGGSDTTQQEYFQLMTSNQTNLNRFVAEAIKYLQKHNFDGIDIDWQQPLADGHHADLIEALLAGFQAEADRSGGERLSVSTTLPTNFTLLRDSFDLARLSTVVDYMSLLTYRFHGSDAAVTGHHAPLHATDMQTTDYADFAVAMCEELGADLGRLLLGVPTFGLTFTLEDAGADGYGAPAVSAGRKGKYTKAAGTLSFYEICEHLSLDGWTAFRPKRDTLGPYAVSGDGQWVAYDDESMMRVKGRYARDRGLGGVTVWALAQDDFRGLCTGRPYPLIEAVKAALQPETQVPPTTQAPPTTPVYDNTPAFTCPGNGRFPKADDCTKFFICVERSSQAMSCPDGEQYDVDRQACSAEADCDERPLVGVTGFPPTPPPVGPQLPPPATPAPPAATPAPPAATPAPPAVAMPSPATPPPPTAPPRPPTPVAVPTASTAFDELQQILELIRRVGGLDVVRRRLEGASATSAYQPDADVSLVGSSRLRVTVTVDLQPL